ncbi:sigma-54 dependent transcriptional regulator [Burkholderia contaminans]|uniref:sigma-54 interaction domain-containing protein n=1 Tax=Burkholderia contaminans TaxID=488447 RepID=UPI001CF1FEB7|nr:sigma-54 dependent transcriptional regulator [Burkholderia contaminans]MCA7918761.1 sigma-54 dependent transcriptional regulator [Burkholderia contaminans]UUX35758.1 sigma-54 dependent transcriptional regulator [Burkholderia contaminans]
MKGLQVALLARDMGMAARPDVLATAFMVAVQSTHGLLRGICYHLNGAADTLTPLADTGHRMQDLPDVAIDEVDNPLVYSLLSGQPCLIDKLATLAGVGIGFERLRACLPLAEGALVLPLRDAQHHAFGAVMFAGAADHLRFVQVDPCWQALTQLHERLQTRLCSDSAATRNASHAEHGLQTERARKRAARLLAAEFVGISAATRRVRDEMLRMTDSSLTILITGETGAGKDHAAWLIHHASPRHGKFVPVNCAAVPKDLIEAELFGTERGAYTGATHARSGLVAEADGGTLFLDEIGDMPLSLQGTLLRLLNEKKYRPLGASRERRSNFRLICATHRPLPQFIAEGRFREDLYFRIRQQTLHIPPLRERAEDILFLADHVLLQHNRERPAHVASISEGARRLLQRHPFPGNVRELRNLVLVAAEMTADGSAIQASVIRNLLANDAPVPPGADPSPLCDLWLTDDLPAALAAFERRLIDHRLQQVDGSRTLAAQSLGIPKRTLARKCLALNLDKEDTAP